MPDLQVLLVEDDPPLAHALELKLRHEGLLPTVAGNGKQALQLLEQPNHYALILLDLMMPEVDGFQVLSRLQSTGSKTPVFVLSNLSQTEDEQRSKDLGARRYFVKSNTPISDIVNAVKQELGT